MVIAGCGDGSTYNPRPTAEQQPLQAEATVKQFLYHARSRSRDCPRLWAPNAQRGCAAALKELLRARRYGAVPHVPPTEYAVSEDASGLVTVQVGNRNPSPQNPPDINALFQLRFFHGGWKILLLTSG